VVTDVASTEFADVMTAGLESIADGRSAPWTAMTMVTAATECACARRATLALTAASSRMRQCLISASSTVPPIV
jgi:hypothetical protein